MKSITYLLIVKHTHLSDDHKWTEKITDVVEDHITPEMHGKKIVDFFNATIKPGEAKREFLRISKF